MMAEENQPSYPCNECQAGILHIQYITYYTWLDDELVSVPNFPAWVCDVCGRREYDQRAIAWLTALLSPETGKPSLPPRRIRPAKEEKRDSIRPSPAE
jgi:YgiT-type zinc finger domain-containing protein